MTKRQQLKSEALRSAWGRQQAEQATVVKLLEVADNAYYEGEMELTKKKRLVSERGDLIAEFIRNEVLEFAPDGPAHVAKSLRKAAAELLDVAIAIHDEE